MQIPREKLILSHTPMQELLPQYQHASVMVVGAGRSLQAAHAYGFSRALSPLQLAAALGPDAAPFSNVPTSVEVSRDLGLPCPVQVLACFRTMQLVTQSFECSHKLSCRRAQNAVSVTR